ncbi:uncharacterized protein LOC110605069 [Manihot esculenta]|uniref:Uncharacterized protein n=1 Tax=Manihot esculenta TaxID=3983 RepID=A0ACB7I7P2_MANES|nr:uncharacterized protein LOC110605069 [Manihot esculenta]KAG8660421.1 hypothetical protein MANES_02G156350v8 [Manihot esculenta]
MTNVSDPPYQQNYSILARPSVDSRLPQLGHHNRKSDQGLDISPYCNSMPSRSRFQQPIHPANLFELQVQSYNSWKNRESLTLSGAHVGGHEGLANQNAGRINNPHILQQSQLFNISETLQNGFLGGHLGKRPSEIGESSPSNQKFSRVESGITQENQGAAWRHQDKLPIQLNLRPARNALYDQGYESVGLPVDPHLRLFALN